MTRVVLELDPTVPPAMRAILASIRGLEVKVDGLVNRLWVDGRAVDLVLTSRRPPLLSSAATDASEDGRNRGAVTMVVAEKLPEQVRLELARVGFAYADGTGSAHFDVPGMLFHVEGRSARRQRDVAPTGLGVVGVRAIQALLTNPSHAWSIPDLRDAAGCSSGEAHRVFTVLEHNRFVTRVGKARSLRRRVDAPRDLLDWLAVVPPARRLREKLDASIYARDFEALVAIVATSALESDLPYAFTGSAGARVLGAGATTSIPIAMIRVHPSVPLAGAALILHAQPVDDGANVRLVRDFGELGTHGRTVRGLAAVAQPARVWLDMLGEVRGEDAAARFSDAAFGW